MHCTGGSRLQRQTCEAGASGAVCSEAGASEQGHEFIPLEAQLGIVVPVARLIATDELERWDLQVRGLHSNTVAVREPLRCHRSA